ncbi:MAG: hypothetical protein HC836_47255 [Richelia sp. RM2_1_2]|nr:hypothetical protein [Richelia sp. RM2_1_2]
MPLINPIVHNSHWIDGKKMAFSREVHIYDNRVTPVLKPSVFNVLHCSGEPEQFRSNNAQIIAAANRYDLILTWDKMILANCKNAVMFPFGMTWIKEEDIRSINVEDKTTKTSFIITNKNNNLRTQTSSSNS